MITEAEGNKVTFTVSYYIYYDKNDQHIEKNCTIQDTWCNMG